MPDGYSYSSADLESVVRSLRHGAEVLDEASRIGMPAPDAGASSALVGETMAGLLRSAVSAAQTLDNLSDGVHATKGSYEGVENTNEGAAVAEWHRLSELSHQSNVPPL